MWRATRRRFVPDLYPSPDRLPWLGSKEASVDACKLACLRGSIIGPLSFFPFWTLLLSFHRFYTARHNGQLLWYCLFDNDYYSLLLICTRSPWVWRKGEKNGYYTSYKRARTASQFSDSSLFYLNLTFTFDILLIIPIATLRPISLSIRPFPNLSN